MAMAAGRVLPTSAPPKISINKLLVCGGGIAPPLLVFTILVLPAQLLPRIEEDLLYTLPVYDDFVEKSGVGTKRRHHRVGHWTLPLETTAGHKEKYKITCTQQERETTKTTRHLICGWRIRLASYTHAVCVCNQLIERVCVCLFLFCFQELKEKQQQ